MTSCYTTHLNGLLQLQKVAHAVDLELPEVIPVASCLQSQKLSLVVVGEFKRGKSTVINALLGESVLPADILPTTATVNRVVFGDTPSVRLHYKSGETHRISVDQLENHVTKLTEDAADFSRVISEATIAYPSYICMKNVDIIDTPGLNDDDEMTAVTLGALNCTQVAIVVMSASAPFAESEALLLATLLNQGIRHLVFVVNRIDECKQKDDVERLLGGIKQRIQYSINGWLEENYVVGSDAYNQCLAQIAHYGVFGVSAEQALFAKKSCDEDLLVQSGFVEFEYSLVKLLIDNRHAIFQQFFIKTVHDSCQRIFDDLTTKRQALDASQQLFEREIKDASNSFDELRAAVHTDASSILRSLQSLSTEVTSTATALPHRLMQEVEEVIDDLLKHSISNSQPLVGKQVASAVAILVAKTESNITAEVKASVQIQVQELISIIDSFNRKLMDIKRTYSRILCISVPNNMKSICTPQPSMNVKPLIGLVDINFERFSEPSADVRSELGLYAAAGAAFGSLILPGIGTAIGGSVAAGYERNRRLKALSRYKPQVLEELRAQLDANQIHRKVSQYITDETKEICIQLQKFREQASVELNELKELFSRLKGIQEAKEIAMKKKWDNAYQDIAVIQQQFSLE